MKHLKTYKIFESVEHRFATQDELMTIEDILINIEDLDFEVQIHKNVGGSDDKMEQDSEVCRVYIEKFAVFGFSQEERECEYSPDEEFISVLQHLVSYVKEVDYDIEIESIHNSESIDKINSEDGDLDDNDILVFIEKPISYIKIIISYKD